jgi:hypothetical protein
LAATRRHQKRHPSLDRIARGIAKDQNARVNRPALLRHLPQLTVLHAVVVAVEVPTRQHLPAATLEYLGSRVSEQLLGSGIPGLNAALQVDSKGRFAGTGDDFRGAHDEATSSAFGSPAVLGSFVL